MRRRFLSCCLALSMIASLTACNGSKGQTTEPVAVESNVDFAVSDTQAIVKGTSIGGYKLREMAPLVRDGKTHGWVTLNQVEHLGIFDWTSSKAVDSGIKHSYTMNFKVDFLDMLSNGDMLTVYLKPVLVRGEKVIGNPCIVGWSGFPETAVFDKNTSSTYVEYGVQPLVRSLRKAKLVLNVSDSNGNEYDPIVYDGSVITKARKGKNLITDSTSVIITGASKARYKVSINTPYVEECFTEKVDDIYDRKYSKYFDTRNALVFKYRVDYLSKPKTDLQVSNIDRSKKDSLLSTNLKIRVNSDNDKTDYYNNDLSIAHWKYRNGTAMSVVSVRDRYKIHVGKYAAYTCNRLVSNAFAANAQNVRFYVELESEALAMTPEQLMKFNGRFIVFQRPIMSRTVYSSKTHKWEKPAVTDDKKHVLG